MNRRGFIKSMCTGVAVATVAPTVVASAMTNNPIKGGQGLYAQIKANTTTYKYENLTREVLEKALREVFLDYKNSYGSSYCWELYHGGKSIL